MTDSSRIVTASDGRTTIWLTIAAGFVLTAAAVAGLLAWWPADAPASLATESGGPPVAQVLPDSPVGSGEPSRQPGGSTSVPVSADLFHGDLPAAFTELIAAAGAPSQLLELAVYPSYTFLAYRDPVSPDEINRRQWRDGRVSAEEPNTIDDRVDAATEPALFDLAELGGTVVLLPQLIADAPSHYDLETEVTHVLVTRFLPFDDRVLIRVYAQPTDGRSGGGYVSYDTSGRVVRECC